MHKNNGKNKKPATRRPVILIAVICILAGFIGGAGFSSFQLGKESPSTGPAMPSKKGNRVDALKTEATRNPGSEKAWINLGNAYFDSDRYLESIDAYSKALEIDPDNANVITDMGVMYRRSGQPQKAVSAFDRAIAADPAHETARLNKGVVLLNDLEDTKGAVAAWEGLLQINPFFMVGDNKSLQEVVEAYK